MKKAHDPSTCASCRIGETFPIAFTMAFQPIIDAGNGEAWAYEALIRGCGGEGAHSILSQIRPSTKYAFDQACRIKAISLATDIGLPATGALLSINFLPNAVYDPKACIGATLAAAERTGFPRDRIMFEITEVEQVDHAHLKRIVETYREIGFKTAIDDFGAGFSGLNLLSHFQPDVVKLDMQLVRNAAGSKASRMIVGAMVNVCRDLGIEVIAEGIETLDERDAMADLGIRLMQGYLFARPEMEALPVPSVPPERSFLERKVQVA